MTLKEFKSKYEQLKHYLNRLDYRAHTCLEVEDFLGDNACLAYEEFIEPHTNKYNAVTLSTNYDERSYLRVLLIDNFYIECVNTKSYYLF